MDRCGRGQPRLLEFGPFAAANRQRRGEGKPETFNFLGFTHICGKKRSNGRFTVVRQTVRLLCAPSFLPAGRRVGVLSSGCRHCASSTRVILYRRLRAAGESFIPGTAAM
jgi:hypothetical protein